MATYKLTMHWNNTKVLDAECSAVIAWHNIRHLMIDNWTGPARAFGDDHTPTLVDLANAPIGTRFADVNRQDNDACRFSAERIA